MANTLNDQEAATLHAQLARLLEQAPADLTHEGAALWMGRVHAIIKRSDAHADAISFAVKSSNTISLPRYRDQQRSELIIIAYRVLAWLEQQMPAQSAGAFIHPGNVFDAYSAISKVLGSATEDVLVVDPYLDEMILIEYGSSVPPGVLIRLLTDPNNYKKNLLPALARWQEQYGVQRPIELRLSEPRRLHDRAIFVDSAAVWTLTQSIKDFAKRAPGHISRVDSIAQEKRDAYEALWAESKPPA